MYESHEIVTVRILADKDKQHQGKCPQRRAAITDKRKGDADHRDHSEGHADIDGKMEEQDRCQTITIKPAEPRSLPFGHQDDPYKKAEVNQNQNR